MYGVGLESQNDPIPEITDSGFRYGCMIQLEMCPGREFNSRQVHQKHLMSVFDGPVLVSTGQIVEKLTTRHQIDVKSEILKCSK